MCGTGLQSQAYTVHVFYLALGSNKIHQCEREAPFECSLCQSNLYHYKPYCQERVQIMRESQKRIHCSTFYPEGGLLGSQYLMILSPLGTSWEKPSLSTARRKLQRGKRNGQIFIQTANKQFNRQVLVEDCPKFFKLRLIDDGVNRRLMATLRVGEDDVDTESEDSGDDAEVPVLSNIGEIQTL
eukprot:Pgem_evm1s18574